MQNSTIPSTTRTSFARIAWVCICLTFAMALWGVLGTAYRNLRLCMVSADLQLLLTLLLGIFATTFHVLSRRGLPLRWSTALVRVVVVLITIVAGFYFTMELKYLVGKGVSIGYALIPGALSYKEKSCAEWQLHYGFDFAEEEKYGLVLWSYIPEIKTPEGAHRMLDVYRKNHRTFKSTDVDQAVITDNDMMFDSLISLTLPTEADSTTVENYIHTYTNNLPDSVQAATPEGADSLDRAAKQAIFEKHPILLKLDAWIHWKDPHIIPHSLELLQDYFHSIHADSLQATKQFRREGDHWILDLRPLGSIDDVPGQLAYIPALHIILAPNALRGANDLITEEWSFRVNQWYGPKPFNNSGDANPAWATLSKFLEPLYDNPPANSVSADLAGESVVAIHLVLPVSEKVTDSSRIQDLNFSEFPDLRSVSFEGTGVMHKAGLVLYASKIPVGSLRFKNEEINGLNLIGFDALRELDVQNMGLSYLNLEDVATQLIVHLAGNHLCDPKVRQPLGKMPFVDGLNAQDCKGRPMQWDSLKNVAELAMESERAVGESNSKAPKVEFSNPTRTDSPIWSEVESMDNEFYQQTNYNVYYPDAVYNGGDIFYGAKFPPLLKGKVKPGMTLDQVIQALGAPYQRYEHAATWYTEDACGEEPFDGLQIGFGVDGKINWVRLLTASGVC